jgi:long-chain acyl-CoA synthetase
LKRGDTMAIVGANRPRLYASVMAAQALGVVPVPVYADAVADELSYVLAHAEVRFAAVEDQEQVDKILSVSDRLPKLETMVYDEKRGLRDYDHTRLHAMEDVIADGRKALAADAGLVAWLDAEIAAGKGSDTSIILYTSGTTGRAKGVVLSYDNLIATAGAAIEFEGLSDREEVLSYLPMAWIGEHIFSYVQAYCAGFCVSCPESGATVSKAASR